MCRDHLVGGVCQHAPVRNGWSRLHCLAPPAELPNCRQPLEVTGAAPDPSPLPIASGRKPTPVKAGVSRQWALWRLWS
jgi:hypothetical protein